MYAIVEIAGQQFKVEKGRTVYTHRLAGDADAALASDQVKVLLVDNDGSISVGAPTVDGATVSAKIVEHLKGEKVIVFKKKRRKGYKKKNGHRQYLTKVLIEDITV
ncbi:ribosomal protein L21 [Fibrisoma limi BUZ 3]|uniref:Large ribosomal subunit protein bL21 n=1 Tax=Fibrisoma limi BUZ 3 TaxID=1185876 RepID=I2GLC6_9BACT|nr:50S ribosomal protein L21 [Fibrisoma limi]CCH54702.1 ribosomal protein L21 [Fibrisoma limi BUZ 3]